MLKNNHCFKINNEGLSLVELIVVIAIMAIIAGASSIGVSFAFSRDAHQCAVKLNDAIYTARMNSMSKAGAYYMEVKMQDGEYVAVINDGTSEVYNEKISENGKIKNIAFELNGAGDNISDSKSVKIVFDKSKGNVREYNNVGFSADGAAGTNVDGLIVFTIDQSRGNKSETVTLVTATGKHKIGN